MTDGTVCESPPVDAAALREDVSTKYREVAVGPWPNDLDTMTPSLTRYRIQRLSRSLVLEIHSRYATSNQAKKSSISAREEASTVSSPPARSDPAGGLSV